MGMAEDARRLANKMGPEPQVAEQERLRSERLANYRAVERFIGPLAKEFAAQAKALHYPPDWGKDRGQLPHWRVPIWTDPEHDTAEYGPQIIEVCIGKRGKWWFQYDSGDSFRGGALTPEIVRKRMVEYLAQNVR